MINNIKNFKLEIIVFTSGAVVMVLEIVGSRVLAPGLGTSTFVWSSLIGVILGALSLGYWLGGNLADKKSSTKILSLILLAAGVAVFILNIIKAPILAAVSSTVGIREASLLAGTILFAPASVLLGIISPYAIRLKLKDVKSSGATVGTLYALSTMGSIFGTFLAGFVLISYFGTSNIIYILSITLFLLSLFANSKYLTGGKVTLIIFLLISLGIQNLINQANTKKGLIDVDTGYSRVFVFDTIDVGTKRPIRLMTLDRQSSSAMFLDGDDLVFEYTKYYNLGEHFKPDLKSALLIGGAAYSYPKEFLKRYPDAKIDVVEIDPKVTELARKYFGLEDNPNLSIYHEDGRIFLNKNEKKYDVIYGDAFSTMYTVPYHLTTKEAVQKIYDSLTDDGVVLINIISAISGEKSNFFVSEYYTFKEVFPQVIVFKVKNYGLRTPQNLMLVGLKTNDPYPKSNSDPKINSYLSRIFVEEISQNDIILTDEYAPVEYFTGKMLN